MKKTKKWSISLIVVAIILGLLIIRKTACSQKDGSSIVCKDMKADSLKNADIGLSENLEDEKQAIDTMYLDSILSTPWAIAYLDFLKKDSSLIDVRIDAETNEKTEYFHHNCWGLAYIDDDEIPEMVLLCSCEAEGKSILSLYQGKVSKWRSVRNSVDYVPRKGLIRNNDGNMGYYFDRFIRLKKGVFTEYLIHETHEIYEDNFLCYTIYNSDTISRACGDECEVYYREKRKFESLPHMDLEDIQTYPTDYILEYMHKAEKNK